MNIMEIINNNHCVGCRRDFERYQGGKYAVVVSSTDNGEKTAWICEDCNQRVLDSAVQYLVFNMRDVERFQSHVLRDATAFDEAKIFNSIRHEDKK